MKDFKLVRVVPVVTRAELRQRAKTALTALGLVLGAAVCVLIGPFLYRQASLPAAAHMIGNAAADYGTIAPTPTSVQNEIVLLVDTSASMAGPLSALRLALERQIADGVSGSKRSYRLVMFAAQPCVSTFDCEMSYTMTQPLEAYGLLNRLNEIKPEGNGLDLTYDVLHHVINDVPQHSTLILVTDQMPYSNRGIDVGSICMDLRWHWDRVLVLTDPAYSWAWDHVMTDRIGLAAFSRIFSR